MDVFLQVLKAVNPAVGFERNGNSSLSDDTLPAILMRALELMMVDVARRQLMPVVEPMIHKVVKTSVKEELVLAMEKVSPSMTMKSGANRGSTSESPNLKLRFLTKIGPEVWTGRKKGEGNPRIEVVLIDGRTGEVVKSRPEAEAKVEIVAIDGDFDGMGERDSWTTEEFNSKIVRECKGKKSILQGNTYLKLKEGKGLSEISFTHSKHWMKNRKFSLGAKVVDSIFTATVKEARTESFILKDWRSTLEKKHYPPSPSDEVWRLKKIQKNGPYHDRLTNANIQNVNDFLTLLSINPKELQKILGISATHKVWTTIVDHAQTCVVNEAVYVYHDPSYEQKTEFAFNGKRGLMGLIIESQYIPVDQLTEDKADGQKLVKSASEHWKEVVFYKDEASLISHVSSQLTTTVKSLSSLAQESSAGSNYRIAPVVINDLGSPTSSNCRNQPVVSVQGNLNGSNGKIPPLVSDHGSLTGYNNINPPLVCDIAGPYNMTSPLVSDQEYPMGTTPLVDGDHLQPSSSSLDVPHSFNPSGSAYNLGYYQGVENTESVFCRCQSQDSTILFPELTSKDDDEFLQSLFSDYDLQQEIPPNIETHPEQQGSASGNLLLVTSQAVCFDQTQKICKMVRQLSIRRIGAAEPEGMHIKKKQRGS